MAGIYSIGGSAGHRYAGWLSEVEAKNFQFGGKVFNGSPSAIYVGSKMVWLLSWLNRAAQQAIVGAFGQRDGWAVIKATNAYLNQLAASDRDKATALAALINEDPMMVCSLGLSGVQWRWLKSDGTAFIAIDDVPINGTTYSNYLWKIMTSLAWTSGKWATQGVGGGSVCTTGMGISASSKWAYADGITDIQGDSSSGYANTPIVQELDFANRTYKVTDMQGNVLQNKTSITVRQPTGTGYNILFGWRNYSKSTKYIHPSKDAYAYLRAGDQERDLRPFRLGKAWSADKVSTGVAQAKDTLGMIDLVTGIFYPNAASSGAFTMEGEPTPSTP